MQMTICRRRLVLKYPTDSVIVCIEGGSKRVLVLRVFFNVVPPADAVDEWKSQGDIQRPLGENTG